MNDASNIFISFQLFIVYLNSRTLNYYVQAHLYCDVATDVNGNIMLSKLMLNLYLGNEETNLSSVINVYCNCSFSFLTTIGVL